MQLKNLTLTLSTLLFSGLLALQGQAQTPCVDGRANGHPCNEVDLLSRLTPQQLGAEPHQGVYLNDIWGWTDPQTGKEYALVGMANGTSFVDVSDPVSPVVIGILLEHHAATGGRAGTANNASVYHDGAKSVWRDIKVYRDHAFIVSEDAGHGMQVFDLRQLRTATNLPVNFQETANYSGISNAHNIAINEATGYAYAVGAGDAGGSCQGGGLHMINIQDPANPVFAGCFDSDGYTHDVQVVVYQGPDATYAGKEIAFAANEDAITLVDVTDKANPVQISSVGYNGVAYAHQGWLTEDQQYFISNDELDEHNQGTNTRSFIWDMRDLDSPRLIGTYVANTTSIDHNLYTKEALVYESNYTSGLRILSSNNIANGELEEVAYFDTYPVNDNVIFEGSWSNYPYFKSGNIIVSDVTRGLYVLRHTLDNPAASETCLSSEAALEVHETRLNVTYQWQVNEGSGFVDLAEDNTYAGVTTPRLQISSVTEDMLGYSYRVLSRKADNTQEPFISEEAQLALLPDPVALFEYTISGNSVTFSNLSEDADSYIWDFGDSSPAVTSANPTHQFLGEPPYTVTLEATNACATASYSVEISEITGLEDALALGITLYPNPSEGVVRVQANNNLHQVTSISLISLSGKSLMTYVPGHINSGKQQFELQLSEYPRGIYLLRIATSNKVINTKLVLE